MRSADFNFITALVREHSGIDLAAGKEYLVESRLVAVCKEEGLASLEELAERLRGEACTLVERIVDAMTTNETLFFRDPVTFELLRTTLIPQLIAQLPEDQPLRIWCAASSSGQEPVSLAILLREYFPQIVERGVRIMATDISPTMVARGLSGLYGSVEMARGLPLPYQGYFSGTGLWKKVRQDILDMIEYKVMNLAHAFMLPQMNLVLMRNVLMYFDEPTKCSVLARVRRVMDPAGILLLGGVEAISGPDFKMRKSNSAQYYVPI